MGTVSYPTIVGFLCLFFASYGLQASPVYPIEFSTENTLGRVFDGIGGLSGGGATSKLLPNYPEKYRTQILDFLFKPRFGASLQILKVEIGGDVQSTDGTESSHMHNIWEENYNRGYQWWMMKEAKKRNPYIKLYALPWGFPGWVGQGTGNPYHNVSVTADYIVRWVNGAKVHHNLTIDYLGLWNERRYEKSYIKALRKALDEWGFHQVKIIASDGTNGQRWEPISRDIREDSEIRKIVHAIGAHYPGTYSDKRAYNTDKKLWASEDYCQVNTERGASCWARSLNQNYVHGYMTATIAWDLIASYYHKLPGSEMGLMTAEEPLSGHYVVSPPIWASAHTTQFTGVGWRYLRHGHGVGILPQNGSYVSLISPDEKEFTIIIETMTHEHAKCVWDWLQPFVVKPQTVEIVLKGNLAKIKELNMWYTELKFDGSESILFEKRSPLQFTDGRTQLELGLNNIITLTTLTIGHKGTSSPEPPPSTPFRLPYFDNFDKGYYISEEPYMVSQQTGNFEVQRDQDQNQYIRQMVTDMTIPWCHSADGIMRAYAIIGDYSWTDVSVDINFRIPAVNGSSGIFIAVRASKGGCATDQARGIFLYALPDKYILASDIEAKHVLRNGTLEYAPGEWHKISLFARGSTAGMTYDGKKMFETQIPSTPENGWAAIGTRSYGLADFDNLHLDRPQ